MKKIVQVNFKFKIPRSDLEKWYLQVAQTFANVKGLLWKIWLMNEAEKSSGGIYLFEDEASAQAFLKGELAAGVKSNPNLSNVEIKVFEVIPEPTKVTRGPCD